jgi:DNA-binding NtrC family response regulator
MSDKERLRIMIIDDDLNSLHSLSRALSLHGYDTEYYDDPHEALKSYASHTYDVIATDYKMPGMDGLTLIRAIRAINPRAKVILFSGYIDSALLDQATEIELEAIFHKPLPLERFLTKLEDLMSLKKQKPSFFKMMSMFI